MNFFEGARRVAVIGFMLIFVGGLVAIYNLSPHVIINYRIMYFGLTPIRLDLCNESVDATRYVQHTTKNGREFSIHTCFRASKSNGGNLLIPYAAAPNNMTYMDTEFSPEVQAYTMTVSNGIEPTEADMNEADSEYIRQSIVNRLKGFGWLILATISYWLLVRIVGWVVRGFMGIPSGQDYRIKPIEK